MSKKETVHKGFFSVKGNPTQNALLTYFIYLSNLPENWNHKKINEDALSIVRKYFGVDYGFRCMINWGIQYGCRKSKTSNRRHHLMSLAYHDALGMLGQKYVYTTVKP